MEGASAARARCSVESVARCSTWAMPKPAAPMPKVFLRCRSQCCAGRMPHRCLCSGALLRRWQPSPTFLQPRPLRCQKSEAPRCLRRLRGRRWLEAGVFVDVLQLPSSPLYFRLCKIQEWLLALPFTSWNDLRKG